MKVLIIASDRSELSAFSDGFVRIVSGVGPFLAAASAAAAIAEHHPDAVFSVGSAGSYGSLSVGECVSFGSVATPDQDLSAFHLRKGSTLLPSRATIGSIDLDRSSSLRLLTSGTFASEPCEDMEADAADMEAYGVAIAAHLASVPCFAVKIITDIVGEDLRLSDYGFNLRSLRQLLPQKVEEVLQGL